MPFVEIYTPGDPIWPGGWRPMGIAMHGALGYAKPGDLVRFSFNDADVVRVLEPTEPDEQGRRWMRFERTKSPTREPKL